MIADRFDGPIGNVCTTTTPAAAEAARAEEPNNNGEGAATIGCGMPGRVKSKSRKNLVGSEPSACDCMRACRDIATTAFLFKPGQGRRGKCFCYATHTRINSNADSGAMVGEVAA